MRSAGESEGCSVFVEGSALRGICESRIRWGEGRNAGYRWLLFVDYMRNQGREEVCKTERRGKRARSVHVLPEYLLAGTSHLAVPFAMGAAHVQLAHAALHELGSSRAFEESLAGVGRLPDTAEGVKKERTKVTGFFDRTGKQIRCADQVACTGSSEDDERRLRVFPRLYPRDTAPHILCQVASGHGKIYARLRQLIGERGEGNGVRGRGILAIM